MIKKLLHARAFLIAEFALLCIALPTLIIVQKLAPHMFAFLWGAAGYCMWVLYRSNRKLLKNMWKWEEVTWAAMKPILLRWVMACAAMAVFVLLYDPERFLFLPRERPYLVLILLFVYPLLSALPQEFIFCTYFFRRYERFFGNGRTMIIASAVVFAYAHVLFINIVAPALSFIAGLIFAQTYAKTKSLALVTIEHGLYGNFLFIIGLGWYFYGGAVQ